MTEENLDKQIMEKIKSGQVSMKSRSYFAARAILFGAGVFLLLAVGIMVISFLLFSLRASGVWRLPEFGGRGWLEFLIYFPWLIAAFAVGFIFLLEWYVKKYSFAYRRPLVYSVLVVAVLLIAGGWFVHETPLHSMLYEHAQRGRLPLFGPMYRGSFTTPPGDEYIGILTDRQGANYILAAQNGMRYTILVTSQTHTDAVSVGDDCVVVGDASGTEISAYGIRKINPNDPFPLRPRHPSRDREGY